MYLQIAPEISLRINRIFHTPTVQTMKKSFHP